MTADRLVSLYYRSRGLCAETGIPLLHYSENRVLAIELDHITPVLRRKSLESVFDGSQQCDNAGLAASMSNVRLVCRIAHRMRHTADNQGVDLAVFCHMLSKTSTHGCEIDPAVCEAVCVADSTLDKASELLSNILADKSRFWSLEKVCQILEQNHLPLSYDQARKLMIDKVGRRLNVYRSQYRESVIRSAVSSDLSLATELSSKGLTRRVVDEINRRFVLVGLNPILKAGIVPYLKKLGIREPRFASNPGTTRTTTCVHSSCRSSLWAFAKSKALDGFCETDVKNRFPTWDSALISVAIGDAIDRNLVETKNGMFYGRLNRHEAAGVLGLTRDVLKKYAVMGKGPPYSIARPGVGSEVTYSYEDLFEWRRLYPSQKRLSVGKQSICSTVLQSRELAHGR
jgi:hypothetical protein